MPVQIFLQGKIAGIEDFLLAPSESDQADRVFAGRSHWISLLSEILPRALLADKLQVLVANLDYSDYLGRIAFGKIYEGKIKVGDAAICRRQINACCRRHRTGA